VRAELLAEHRDEVQRLALKGLQWPLVAHHAALHGIAPLVYKAVKPYAAALCAEAGPLKELRHAYLSSAVRSDVLLRELRRVVRALAARGIEAIPLKGAWLSQWVYAEPALRPMGDIDLLLRRDEMPAFVEIVRELGYRASRPTSMTELLHGTNHQLPALIHPDTRTVLEAHWELDSHYRDTPLDSRALWQGARRVAWEDVQVALLSPEHNLLWQCLHVSAKHGYIASGIRDIGDIAAILTHLGRHLQWAELWDGARAQGWAADVAVPIALAERLVQVPLDQPLPSWLRIPGWLVECAEGCVLLAPTLRPYLQPTARKEIRRGYVHFVRKMVLTRSAELAIPYDLPSWWQKKWRHYTWLVRYLHLRLGILRKRREGQPGKAEGAPAAR